MPRVQSDTKAEIRDVAMELFGRQGYERTSLREIAERLGLTKAALYYHYPSKRDLLAALVNPLVTEAARLLERHAGGVGAEELLGEYFDLCVRHSDLVSVVLNDVTALSEAGLIESVVSVRRRLDALLIGVAPGTPARMGAVVALGGIQDIAVMLPAHEAGQHRARAVWIAMAALRSGTAPGRAD
ncbi:TetR/AcrR family transcriptional regulator [Nocardiopsis kunsanensis]|uniref:TetR family transcriptional regulator n=1 Tax=Nocardiopsis kunsanensis TaxID=141693 RepID=A0A918XFX8_9ACTN|nr:TetR/AcrR family transcriptional regulator [Nocardiopsis kunsanensis]GHD30246.1 TetR family transcriptional regulator [Nocardiopsis kunsanensis]